MTPCLLQTFKPLNIQTWEGIVHTPPITPPNPLPLPHPPSLSLCFSLFSSFSLSLTLSFSSSLSPSLSFFLFPSHSFSFFLSLGLFLSLFLSLSFFLSLSLSLSLPPPLSLSFSLFPSLSVSLSLSLSIRRTGMIGRHSFIPHSLGTLATRRKVHPIRPPPNAREERMKLCCFRAFIALTWPLPRTSLGKDIH